VADDFAERYGDLLTGSYDCVDRVVLNAYFPLGHNPGGFRCWWRRLHGGSDDQLDDTHLMRMAGRFARRVKGWAAAKTGIVAVPIAASSCARRPPPNSRAVRPPATTVVHAASAGHTRSPVTDTPNSFSDTHASSGASTG